MTPEQRANWTTLGKLLWIAHLALHNATLEVSKVMPVKQADRVANVDENRVGQLRSDWENEMLKRTGELDMDIFYPGGPNLSTEDLCAFLDQTEKGAG